MSACGKQRRRTAAPIAWKVLKKVEEYHKMKGFKFVSLCTHTFQASEFYKKCGFTLEFIRENKKIPD